ncbi:fibronectin type III domain-containing protein, partial [Flavobacterium oreochromis]|uniref:fibronectin type III domain-containing protein n=1 Tax=Flavobacterium oreochromis TaxID=2906078 RepID=UPI00385ACDAD
FVLSEALSARSVRVSWLGDHTHTKYHVQYRKANVAGAEWFEVYTMNTQTTLSDLEAGTTYEFRVGGSCEPAVLGNMASFTYSGINTFTMQSTRGTANSNFTCGLKPSITIANQTPITNLIINETFTAGDFPVKILELSGGNGNYSGKGYVIVPYLADTKIAVEFTNITINTSYQLIKGVVETSYNPQAPNISDVEDLSGGNNNQNNNQNNTPILNFPITNVDAIQVNISQGTINITAPNGQITSVPLTPNQPTTLITDNQGNGYEVNNTTGEVKPVNTISEVVTAEEQAKATLKFKYKETELLHKDKLATMLHGKNLKIQILNKNQASPINIEKTKIKLGDNNLILIKENGNFFVNIKADASTLTKAEMELEVMDSLAKNSIAKLKIVKYFAPIVKFKKPDNYNGDFLFDDGFERHTALKSPNYYSTFRVGKDNQTYYSPVVGLKRTQIKTIKIDLTDFESIAKKDPDFKLVIKPTINNKIKINTLDSLVINANELSLLKEIQIEAKKTIDTLIGRNLTAMFIECKIKESKEKVGQIEYYCALPVRKSIRLIYTKFSDETNFPNPYSDLDLQNFLNNNSHNQLFIEYTVTNENLDITTSTKSTFMNGKNTMEALYLGLLNLKYGTPTGPVLNQNYLPPGIDDANDFYFITNLEKEKFAADGSTSLGFIGGGHFRSTNGGLFLKTPSSAYNETSLETDSHEFGHWVGLPHTFEEKDANGSVIPKPQPFFTVHTNEGDSQHNFMDYKIKRKTFFKIQLLNRVPTSN